MKDNSHIYSKYMRNDRKARWATREEIQRSGTFVDFDSESYADAGLPLLSNGRVGHVDGKDTHTLIFGSTGSKKTRLFGMPMLNIFAGAGESFVATDPKGELFTKTSGFVKSKGYNIVTINFRDLDKGDMWNPLAVPYRLYKEGKTDEATAMLNDFVATIAEPQIRNSKDVYWPEAASSLALANLLLLMECGRPEEINTASLARMSSQDCSDALNELADNMTEDSLCALNYKGVLSAPENTLRCVYSTLFSMVRIFVAQKNLAAKLAGNTVDMRTFGTQKTAVYIIVPDEKTTYHFLVTTFIKQVYETLIEVAQQLPDKRLPVRVNFVLDEFCNIPKIPDMPSMISAARSRNMRFYLIAQSYHQLKSKYGEDSDTIKGNCDNWVFLTSKELSLLHEISELCGNVESEHGQPTRLISESELQRLSKEKGEALIIHARQYPIITEIADIDDYGAFRGYESVPEVDAKATSYSVFDIKGLGERVRNDKCIAPFGEVWAAFKAEGREVDYYAEVKDKVPEGSNPFASYFGKPRKTAGDWLKELFGDDDDDGGDEDFDVFDDGDGADADTQDVSEPPESNEADAIGELHNEDDDAPDASDLWVKSLMDNAAEDIDRGREKIMIRHLARRRKIAGKDVTSGGYEPKPMDTSDVVLPDYIVALSEELARNTHAVWSKSRMDEGWIYGARRSDIEREHPCLVEYDKLPESEKDYDRNTALEALRLIVKLGYKIEKPED